MLNMIIKLDFVIDEQPTNDQGMKMKQSNNAHYCARTRCKKTHATIATKLPLIARAARLKRALQRNLEC